MRAGVHTIAVCGATGRQGGAVARSLLAGGWHVRALTRDPAKKPARALRTLGAEVVAADMDQPASLERALEGVHGVYSVQNGLTSGFEREVRQGCNVADAARSAGVDHLVYGSAGPGDPSTGVPSWDAKLRVEAHLREVGVPFTTLRPQAFMELMTDKGFYPALGTWSIWPRIAGDQQPIPWLAVADLGAIATAVFADADRFVGEDLVLAADVRSLAECRRLHEEITGRPPPSFPVPMWLFDRFTRKDITTMWRWISTGTVSLDTTATRALLPTALTVREWLAHTRLAVA